MTMTHHPLGNEENKRHNLQNTKNYNLNNYEVVNQNTMIETNGTWSTTIIITGWANTWFEKQYKVPINQRSKHGGCRCIYFAQKLALCMDTSHKCSITKSMQRWFGSIFKPKRFEVKNCQEKTISYSIGERIPTYL